MGRKEKYYALYRGDEYITQGTKVEIAKFLGIAPNSVAHYGTPVYQKRRRTTEHYELIVLEDEDE